jgi:hypothetical protein
MSEYRKMMVKVDVLEPFQLQHCFQGCYACPSRSQEGTLHWAADGNFRSFRYRDRTKTDIQTAHHQYMIPKADIQEKLSAARNAQVQLAPEDKNRARNFRL